MVGVTGILLVRVLKASPEGRYKRGKEEWKVKEGRREEKGWKESIG